MRTLTTITVLLIAAVGSMVRPAIAEEKVLKAKPLEPGDTIAIVAPAGPLDRERVERATKRLEEMGFKVKQADDLFRSNDYLAGSDEARLAELMAAFADPEVDGIFPGTGGYGTTRIVDGLDYDVIRNNPKVFIGFSDITALHIAINQQTGLITFHSPNPQWGLGSQEHLAPIANRLFWRAVLAREYASTGKGDGPTAGYLIRPEQVDGEVPAPATWVAGKGRGRLIGGNLSLVHALMGTANEIETDGRLLFLEDVGEAPYRVDRMLQTLKSGGKLDRLAGAVLGSFTRRKSEDTDDEIITIEQVLRDFFADAPYPVLADFPVGHQRNNSTLPVGAMAELDATAGVIRLLEDPVALPATR